MRKTSSIVLLAATIFGAAQSILYLVVGIYYIVFGAKILSESNGDGTAVIVIGVILLILAVNGTVGSFLCHAARKEESKARYISTLVVSALGTNPIGIVGSIFGLVHLSRKDESDEFPEEDIDDANER